MRLFGFQKIEPSVGSLAKLILGWGAENSFCYFAVKKFNGMKEYRKLTINSLKGYNVYIIKYYQGLLLEYEEVTG